jgi:hypothetical protein
MSDLGSDPRAVMKYDLNRPCPYCGSQIKSWENAIASATGKSQIDFPIQCGACGRNLNEPVKGIDTVQSRKGD